LGWQGRAYNSSGRILLVVIALVTILSSSARVAYDPLPETGRPPSPDSVGTWHHVAGVLRSGKAELYVDGVLVARETGRITSVR